MKIDQIEKMVIQSITELLISLGKEVPKINGDSMPITDLGLASEDGVDWVCDLDNFGFHVPNNANPFTVDKGPDLRNIREIAEFLSNYYVYDKEKVK